MDTFIRECALGGGVTATVTDCTRHYFGGYYHVRILISADVPLTAGSFETVGEYDDALARFGHIVTFTRTLEKMAVPASEIDDVRTELLAAFDVNVLPYLQRDTFAAGFVRSEYLKKIKPVRHYQR